MLKEEREDSDMKQQVETFTKFVGDAAQKYELESFTPKRRRTGGEGSGRKLRKTDNTGESVIAIAPQHSYTHRKGPGQSTGAAADTVAVLRLNGYEVEPNVIVDEDGGTWEAIPPVR
jgi:hypothetical protein